MTDAHLLDPSAGSTRFDDRPPAGQKSVHQDARVRFRQPVSTAGYVDAGWWPRSLDLAAELPALLDLLWSAGRNITHISYNITVWDPAPRRLTIAGRVIRLGGFTVGDPLMVGLTDAWGRDRIDVLVIPADTDPLTADRALRLASEAGGTHRAAAVLDLARHGLDPATGSPR